MILRPPSLILFNGPRHSGKDTAALFCEEELGAYHFKMSAPLKAGIKAMFNLTDEQILHLESIKTEPSPLLHGKSYVEVQITLSEEYFKPRWGNDVFGQLAKNHLAPIHHSLFVCSDSGFAEEVAPLLDLFGAENTLLVKITRPGKTFAGDSRSYIELPPSVQKVEIENTTDVESYHHMVRGVIQWWTTSRKG